jgi:peptidyl-tRNA hydrolase
MTGQPAIGQTDDRQPATGQPAPTGAALAPLRARYASWLGLDTEHVLLDRDEDPARIRALQIVLRLERDRTPSWHAALALAARGCAQLCLDPRAEPGGEWFDAIHDYCTGHIRKVTRRARAGHWDAIADLPGITLTAPDNGTGSGTGAAAPVTGPGTEIRVLLPGLVSELDKRVSRLQVGGTDAPRDDEPAPRPQDRPLGAALRVWVNPAVTMTLGKTMAQAGHAGMIAAALLAGTDPIGLRRWAAGGMRTSARLLDRAVFDRMLAVLADPAAAWQEHGLLAVRDAGFTEIDPGTVTVIAKRP